MSTFNVGDKVIYHQGPHDHHAVVIPLENCPPDHTMIRITDEWAEAGDGMVPSNLLEHDNG
jgi:hypothetical protein